MKLFSLLLCQIVLTASVLSQNELKLTTFFSTDKFTLSEFEVNNLHASIDSLRKSQIIDVTISAFCDDRGHEVYNEKLSSKRALYIKELLIEYGIDPNLISSVKGNGELNLEEIDLDVQTQRANNRKAEIYLTSKSTKVSSITPQPTVEIVQIETLEIDSIIKVPPKIFVINDSLKIGDKMILSNILFEGGSHKILIESIPVIKKLVDDLKKYNQYHFMIQAVYDYLVTNGISKKRLKYEGLKNKFPLDKGDKFDRRVELKVTKIDE